MGERTETDRAYDAFAPRFRAYSEEKSAYIDAVDRIVARRVPQHARSLLDVGAGDGVRAVRLARSCGIETVVLAEPSSALHALCLAQPVAEVWRAHAEALPETARRFDVVTCLWNVLGHVAGREARLRALAGMGAKLAGGGVLFLDVNNRYNAAHYGWPAVLKNLLRDTLKPATAGDFIANRKDPQGATMHTFVHVFSRGELHALCRDAGLKPVEEHYLDYDTGETRTRWSGQMCFRIEAA